MIVPDLTVWQWIGASAAAALVGLSKAGFGAGAGILAVPLMASALGAADMLSVMLLVLITGDVFSLIHYLDKHDRRNLAMLLPGLLIGIAAGSCILQWFLSLPASQLWMNRLIGFFSVSFVVIQSYGMIRERRGGVSGGPYRPKVWQGVGLGSAAGLTSTLGHAGGYLAVLFLLPQKLAPDIFVGTLLKYFFIGNCVKLIPYYHAGLMTANNAVLSLMLLPGVVVGTLVGVRLVRKFSDRAFRGMVYGLALLVGVYLMSGWGQHPAGARSAEEPRTRAASVDGASRFEEGMEAYAGQDLPAAAAAFGAAADVDGPWRDAAIFNRALALYQAGRYADAAIGFQALSASADVVLGLRADYNRGNCAFRCGRFGEAAERYLGVLRTGRAQLTGAGGTDDGARGEAVRDVIARADHNLALAQAMKQQPSGSPAGSARREAGAATGASSPGQAEAASLPPGPATLPAGSESRTGYAAGDGQGARTVQEILAQAASQDTGPVLRHGRTTPTVVGPDW